MNRTLALILALAGGIALAAPAIPTPREVLAAATEAGRADLWPGFDPNATPLAIYDGTRTWLFRHPQPPAGFAEVSPGVWALTGRHLAVNANSSARIGGVMTATLMPGPGDALARAGTAIHETFHAFENSRHPLWMANEVSLFEYPFTDAPLLAMRRLESAALARALAATTPAESRCWSVAALDARASRFKAMPGDAGLYESSVELYEGLAEYVENRAIGTPDAKVFEATPASDGFAPAQMRQRGYASGAAMGRLLDRIAPDWRATLEQADRLFLHDLLKQSLPADAAACAFTAEERAAATAAAITDVAALVAQRAEARRAFEADAGWKIVVEGGTPESKPLFPQNFDPWNVLLLGPGEVLHQRTVKLGNKSGSLETLGQPTLTVAAGAHPLFNGITRATIGGIPSEPKVSEQDGVLTLSAPEVTVAFKGGRLSRAGRTLTVRY